MGIDGIGSTSSISQLDPLLQIQTSAQVGSTGATDSTTSDVSDFASVMNELQQLQQSDPDKFKQVMSSIATTVQTDASNATGSQARFLSQLAGKFQQAAQTGTMTPLEPSGAGLSGHHGHHHHHAVQSYAAQQAAGSGSTQQQQQPFDLAQIIQGAMQQVGS